MTSKMKTKYLCLFEWKLRKTDNDLLHLHQKIESSVKFFILARNYFPHKQRMKTEYFWLKLRFCILVLMDINTHVPCSFAIKCHISDLVNHSNLNWCQFAKPWNMFMKLKNKLTLSCFIHIAQVPRNVLKKLFHSFHMPLFLKFIARVMISETPFLMHGGLWNLLHTFQMPRQVSTTLVSLFFKIKLQ